MSSVPAGISSISSIEGRSVLANEADLARVVDRQYRDRPGVNGNVSVKDVARRARTVRRSTSKTCERKTISAPSTWKESLTGCCRPLRDR